MEASLNTVFTRRLPGTRKNTVVMRKRLTQTLALFLAISVLHACKKPGVNHEGRETSREVPADAVTVRISYGSEKKAFLVDAIDGFQRSNAKTQSGKVIRIQATAEGSAESMEAILAGQSDAHVWSPASSLLVDVLNARWAEKQGQMGGNAKIVGDAPPLALSPVVIAMWEPMARALGWPQTPIGWAEIAKLSMSEQGWRDLGKPQWGDFRFGHTHPRYSNSGAIALIAATYAGAGKSRDLSAEDAEKAAAFVKRVQSHVVHYGRSTGFFAEKMFTRGPGYLSAAVLYENLVAESYTDSKYQSKPFPVVAIYPKEGTFWADHPYAILDIPSVTPEIREAAEAFKKYLLSADVQRKALQSYGLRPADPNIPLGAPIDAAHGLDPSQPKNVLPSPPVAVTRKILENFESVKRPVVITFVLDTSGSMKGEPLQAAKGGAQMFFEGLSPSDSVRLILFSSKTNWAIKNPVRMSESKDVIVAAVNEAFAMGETSLYDSIVAALQPETGGPTGAIRAVVVLTDGKDTSSTATIDVLLASLQRTSGGGEEGTGSGTVPRVFTIGYGSGADPEVLKKIAEAGGGAYFSGDPKNIRSVYAELATFF
jgi:Ca-activated chloride channel family protein